MAFKSSDLEALKVCILMLQWHLIKELFQILLPLLVFGRGGGLSWHGRWLMLTLWGDEWQNHSLSSKVGTGWASAATASRPKNNWIEMALGSFLLRTEAVPSQLKALHNSHYHCQGAGNALGIFTQQWNRWIFMTRVHSVIAPVNGANW